MSNDSTQLWYDKSYLNLGFEAQRRYPNEELCRFIGRNFSSEEDNATLSCLEVGCGSGGNLWMLAEKQFDVTGLDISEEGLVLTQKMLDSRGQKARLVVGSMTDMPFTAESYDLIVDVFSSNCLPIDEFKQYLREAYRIMKPNGLLFIYTPSKSSDAYLNHYPSRMVDEDTLEGILRESSPFYGNKYPFRFEHPVRLECRLKDAGFKVNYLETTSRTYNHRSEYFEFVVAYAKKP